MVVDKDGVPFKVGELAETRSFMSGFRGAWFRCKINGISRKKVGLGLSVEYYDFPDEKVRWTKLYQKFCRTKEYRLMVRPSFPPVYHEDQSLDIKSISDVRVILNGGWKVGDLVDWFSDGCYWSGRLTKVLGDEKFQIELFPPPEGEGLSYEVSTEDLRPSLDWSPKDGWTVPIPMGNEDCRPCARIVISASLMVDAFDEERKDYNTSISSDISASHLPHADKLEKMPKQSLSTTTWVEIPVESAAACVEAQPVKINKELHVTDSGIGKASCSDSVSSLRAGDLSPEIAENLSREDRDLDNGLLKKMRTDRSITLNSMTSDTIEDAIMDLEELVNRVKWMKDILQFGLPLPTAVRPSWEFVEHRAPSLPK